MSQSPIVLLRRTSAVAISVLLVLIGMVAAANRSTATPPKSTGVYAMAYRGTNGDLWVYGGSGNGDTGVPMMAGTHAAVVEVNAPVHGYQIVVVQEVQGRGYLATVGPLGWHFLDLCVAAATSPAAIIDTQGAAPVLRIEAQLCGGSLFEIDNAVTPVGA